MFPVTGRYILLIVPCSVNAKQAQKEGARRTVYWVHGEKYLGDWVNNKKEGRASFCNFSYI